VACCANKNIKHNTSQAVFLVIALRSMGEVKGNTRYSSFTCFDLEMNQPSGRIIQIGAVFGSLISGKIYKTVTLFINPGEALNQEIEKLTGISDNDLRSGISLIEGYEQLEALHHKYCSFTNPLVWGVGDSEHLRREIEICRPNYFSDKLFCFGRRWLDVKSLFQMYCLANNLKMRSGLHNSMAKAGLTFQGQNHNAADDALNTFLVAHKLVGLLKIDDT
jgi:DNA polymerase III epsilon subunit-like protein